MTSSRLLLTAARIINQTASKPLNLNIPRPDVLIWIRCHCAHHPKLPLTYESTNHPSSVYSCIHPFWIWIPFWNEYQTWYSQLSKLTYHTVVKKNKNKKDVCTHPLPNFYVLYCTVRYKVSRRRIHKFFFLHESWLTFLFPFFPPLVNRSIVHLYITDAIHCFHWSSSPAGHVPQNCTTVLRILPYSAYRPLSICVCTVIIQHVGFLLKNQVQ